MGVRIMLTQSDTERNQCECVLGCAVYDCAVLDDTDAGQYHYDEYVLDVVGGVWVLDVGH